MTSTVDVTVLADLPRRAAKAEILPRFRRLGQDDVRAKSEATDLVTEADEQAERMIKAEAAQLWPSALFLGEESVAADPDLLGSLEHADLAIVVDPVDGTFNLPPASRPSASWRPLSPAARRLPVSFTILWATTG